VSLNLIHARITTVLHHCRFSKEVLVCRVLSVLFAAVLFVVPPAAAQEAEQPPPAQPANQQSEAEQLEEDFIRSREENGQSHASGARPELGPVILGNPTASVVALRVGLHTTTFTSAGAVVTEFSSLHHQFVDLTNTDGDVKVVDLSVW
jgi:hypothetical protein